MSNAFRMKFLLATEMESFAAGISIRRRLQANGLMQVLLIRYTESLAQTL